MKWDQTQADRDRKIYEEVVVKGRTTNDLAAELGLSGAGVRLIVKRQEKKNLAKFEMTVEQIKREHTRRLYGLYDEVYEEWQRSKDDAETIQETEEMPEAGDDDGGSTRTVRELVLEGIPTLLKTKRVITRKGQTGNASYVGAMNSILEHVEKIWGANEPTEIKVSGTIDVRGEATPVLTREELQAKIDERLRALGALPLRNLENQQPEKGVSKPARTVTLKKGEFGTPENVDDDEFANI